MDQAVSVGELARLRRQRNMMMVVAIALLAICALAFLAAATKTREVVLQPINRTPLEISTSGVSHDYLEMVTRDVTYVLLNRSPDNLHYWKDSILEMTSPQSRGKLAADLEEIVKEQSGGSTSQYFTIAEMTVDPDMLESEVVGTLHTAAGSNVTASFNRRFRFVWTYEGLTLRLADFGEVVRAPGEEQ